MVQGIGVRLKSRFDFQNDAVLAELGKNCRDLALAERIVKGVINGLRENIEASRFVAIHLNSEPQAFGLLVSCDIRQGGGVAQRRQQFGRPFRQFCLIGVLQCILELGAAHATVNLDVLSRLHEEGDALDGHGGIAQVFDDFLRAPFPLVAWLEANVNAARIDGGIYRPGANERRDAGQIAFYAGIIADDVHQMSLVLRHGLERNGLRGVGDADDQARVLLRQKPLGHDDIQPNGPDKSGEKPHHRQRLVPQHPFQATVVRVQQGLKHPLSRLIEPAMLLVAF